MESFDDVAYTLNTPTDSLSRPEEHSITSTNGKGRSNKFTSPEEDSKDVKGNSENCNAQPRKSSETRIGQESPDKTPTFGTFDHKTHDEIPIFAGDGEVSDEEPDVAKSFERSSEAQASQDHVDDSAPDDSISKMHKFSLYETSTRYYMVGMDMLDRRFRVLKIDRTSESDDLTVSEDDRVYTKKEMNQLLDAVDDGNKSSGGLKLRCSSWGLLGFIKFTGPYYMLLITKRSQVAMIGGHYIYQIDGTELVPLAVSTSTRLRPEKNPEESRYIAIMNNIDLTRSFYFSYSYDITHTLQNNIARDREALANKFQGETSFQHNGMFVWNSYLLKPFVSLFQNAYDWCLPIIHGYVDQAALSVYGRVVYLTIIARRSRFFAGARFLKRGANDLGYVANDVETEQIVSEMLTTSFHSPGPKFYSNPSYTSYVQHRGSIPLHWTQDSTGVSPKPNIELNLTDPFYTAAALHFDNLFERYGTPVYVLNLIKSRERVPRESKLLKEYTNAINYLNQFLPEDKKILYNAWDMSRASKAHDQDVIGTLEDIAEDIIPRTNFFKNGENSESGLKLQNGIVRTNCIDCLDRTNAAQFVIGKRALGHQLRALGVIDQTTVEYDTDAVNLFTSMWHHHGDSIAVQYGGSHLVNTMATYRKINQWTGHSRDMVESFKRYYNNSFLDAQRQEAYNLFLGNYIFSQSQPMLWDLTTDYYLHHSDPRALTALRRRNYVNWYTPEFLQERKMPPIVQSPHKKSPIRHYDDYWLEYYRPLAVSSFSKIFSFKIKSTLRYLPFRSMQQVGDYNLSPFVVRAPHEPEHHERKAPRRKGVTIKAPSDGRSEDTRSSPSTYTDGSSSYQPMDQWLSRPMNSGGSHSSQYEIMRNQGFGFHDHHRTKVPTIPETNESIFHNTNQIAQWSLDGLVSESLNPSVSASEANEYERYINHPLKVPLVVTSEDTLAAASLAERGSNLDLFEYVNKCLLEEVDLDSRAEENLPDYLEFLNVDDEGLTVAGEDHDKKRYKRYRQWLRGKSLFKQRFDP